VIIPCEVAVKSVIPAVKALMANELLEKQDLTQDRVAEILGISQSAVSKYMRKIRGYAVKVDDMAEIQPLVHKMTTLLRSGAYERKEFLKCFCRTCMVIRKTSIMCHFCQKTDPALNVEECGYCSTYHLVFK
jgi:predicted transcriptional regulator